MRKFGSLDASTRERIEAAASFELELWLERVVLAEDLDAVFRADAH